MNLLSFFSPRIILRTNSPLNGDIEVSEYRGTRELIIGGLQQSGVLVEELWEKGLQKIQRSKESKIQNVLLFGVGGGSVIPVLRKKFPESHITAVEIDPVIVEVGMRYFGLGTYGNLELVTDDAFDYVKNKTLFDLILVDVYVGSEIPGKIKSKVFLANIKRNLRPGGSVVFNHIHDNVIHHDIRGFEKKLRSVFSRVAYVDVLVNRLFICSD